ncbi:SDR family oxidoreductase [Haliea sp.]|jgi:NAD(P)-dependent dehydrogenase (short-subunit alcohol dehydrogenase family)|uniref:SDR family NAD(P)-dependent oxidoreductase n=1 Tax=Haliea sp. TaxID=1932666 RepID=UPI000C3A4B72|nr:SDR family oxidoreductase [Haliea sp.]MAD63077.1 2-deoxy-D-gluconate 3-dehydrogenase [Haliea sp.]MAY91530.1 2-deoxy-D-gluconate 3-dehydrogenase [Haliea sp.]MBK40513.1 2-deoxy-D-gluconate 3-dehydrogenase [Haliea sp.]MBP68612.1 2-deoxy-D-gluconate 3-dehydrogenase [Haliea sp.]|tara:strand:- start:3565 stop:4332 length:768 start_codon:yes stop_codon:yes gene_type:complete
MSKNPFDMTGKVVLITGAGSGLGRRFAMTLARQNALIIACGRRMSLLEETVRDIETEGGSARALTLDVSNSASVSTAFETIEEIGRLDTLINNAGTISGPLLLDLEEELWDTVLDVNLKGAWLVARAAARMMKEQDDGGSIINISSIVAESVQKGTGAYAAAKAGLSHLTRAMALEWARYNIRVNALAPGYFNTDISRDYLESPHGKELLRRIPQRRTGELDDLDGPIQLLATDLSRYMTGSVITVDGGLGLSII